MRKRILSMVLALFMVMALLPTVTLTASAADIEITSGSMSITAGNTYTINSATQLGYFRDIVNNGNNCEGATIRLTESVYSLGAWTPIGSFAGTFDGGGKTINGMNITYTLLDKSDYEQLGLFREIHKSGTVKNLGIEGRITFSGSSTRDGVFAGGIVGTNNGRIENCHNQVSITAAKNTKAIVMLLGGIAGCNIGTITSCSNNGFIVVSSGSMATSIGPSIGGISGGKYGWGELIVRNCYNNGAVNSGDADMSRGGVGGIVGEGAGFTIENCYNTGAISGANNDGIAHNTAGISNCYQYNGSVFIYYNSPGVTSKEDASSLLPKLNAWVAGKPANGTYMTWKSGSPGPAFHEQWASYDITVNVKKDGTIWNGCTDTITLKDSGSNVKGTLTLGQSSFTVPVPKGSYSVYAGATNVADLNIDGTTQTTTKDVNYFTISVADGTHMSGAKVGDNTSAVYLAGSTATLNPGTAATGYTFSQWDPTATGNTITVNASGTYKTSASLNPPTVTVTANKTTVSYEDSPIILTANPGHLASVTTYTYQWYKDGSSVSGATGKTLERSSVSDSGNYTCKVKASDGSLTSAETTSNDVSVTINQKPMNFSVNGKSQTYQAGTQRVITINSTGTNLAPGNLAVKYYKVDEDNACLASISPVVKAVSIGRYLYVIDFAGEQPNYKINRKYSVANPTLPILTNYDNIGYLDIKAGAETQKPIFFGSAVVNKYATDTTFQNTLTNENTTTPTYASSNASVATVASTGVVTIKGAGSTTITATSKKDGTPDVYASYTLIVSKKPVTLTVKNGGVTYGDSYTGSVDWSEAISVGDYSGSLIYTGYTVGKSVGEYEIKTSGLTSNKYEFTYQSGTLTVDPKILLASDFVVSATNKAYDGTTEANVTAMVKSTSLGVASDKLGVIVSGTFDNESTGTGKTVSYTITSLAGSRADNYILGGGLIAATTKADISKLNVIFSFGTHSFLYDGTEKPVFVSAYDQFNKVFTDFKVKYAGNEVAPVDAGAYAIICELNDTVNYVTSNNTTTLTINKAPVVVWANNTSQEHDGSAKFITATSYPDLSSDINITYYSVTPDNKVGDEMRNPTAVGKYLYVISQSNGNYEIKNAKTAVMGADIPTGSNCGILEIGIAVQNDLSFADSLVRKTYGDELFTVAPTGGVIGAEITYESKDTSVATVNTTSGEVTLVKPGLVTIIATAKKVGYGDVAAAYALLVEKKSITITLTQNAELIYNGFEQTAPHTISGAPDNGLTAENLEFTYTNVNVVSSHTARNVATYHVTAKLRADNTYYVSDTASGVFTITKALLNVTAGDKAIIYGEAPANDGVAYTTLLGTDTGHPEILSGTLTYAYNYIQYGDVGEYTIIPSGLNSNNYLITYSPGKLTVAPKPVTLSWGEDSLSYNGNAQNIIARVQNAVNNDTVMVSLYTDNEKKDVGHYTAEGITLYNSNYTVTGGQNLSKVWEITSVQPTLSLKNKTAANTGSSMEIGPATVTGVGSDGDMTGNYTVTYTYYSDAARQTVIASPSDNGTYYVSASIPAQGNYTAVTTNATLTIHTPNIGGGSTSGGPSVPSNGVPVIVDGKSENIGTESNSDTNNTVIVDQTKLTHKIRDAAVGSWVVIPINGKGSATAQLMVKNVEEMAANNMTLSVQTGDIAYNIAANAIDMGALTGAFPGVDTGEIYLDVTIQNRSITLEGERLILSPVEFTITAAYNGTTINVDTFNSYINRTIEITAEQAAQITTAVVINADGSTRHVPTNIIERDGKYYAIISSRTNSTYGLIGNDVNFKDASGMWYKAAVNEMGSRKIIAGRKNDVFDGGTGITRAEFSAILIRALGLPTYGASTFGDISASAWYSDSVATAEQYGLVTGKGENKFYPSAKITRQEAMAMLQRAAKLTKFDGTNSTINSFTDASSVDEWAQNAVEWGVGSSLIVGSNGFIHPKNHISRAESATIILRLLQKAELVDMRAKI